MEDVVKQIKTCSTYGITTKVSTLGGRRSYDHIWTENKGIHVKTESQDE